MKAIQATFFSLIFFYFSCNFAYGGNLFIAKESIISSNQEKLINELSGKIHNLLPGYKISTIDSLEAGKLTGKDNIILAIGEKALNKISKSNGDSPVIALFISQSTFYSKKTNHHRITAIYSDPPPDKQVALIKAIFGKSASIGIITSPSTKKAVDEAIYTAKLLNVDITSISIDGGKSPKEIIDTLKNSRSLLLIKDAYTLKKLPLETILILGYDINNLGVIGYSSGVVKNGALATTYISLSDTALSVALLIKQLTRDQQLPKPQHSAYFSVIINKYVMRSLGIKEVSESDIKDKINSLLKERK